MLRVTRLRGAPALEVHGALRGEGGESQHGTALWGVRPALLPQDVQVQRSGFTVLEAEAVQRPLCLLQRTRAGG